MIRKVLLVALVGMFACGQAEERRPAVAFLVFGAPWAHMPDTDHLDHVRAAGFEVDTPTAKELTWEQLRRYNVVVIYEMPAPEDGQWSPLYPQVPALLERFVRAGGGLLSAGLRASHGRNEAHNLLLAPFAMHAPYERLAESDPGRLYVMPRMFPHRFLRCTDIAAGHPITDGVRTLWTYIAGDGATMGQFPHPLVPGDDAWTVLVRAPKTCRSIRMPDFGERTDESTEPAVTYAHSPPLLAARDFDKGRLAVSVINQSHLIFNGWHFAYEGVAMAKGDGVTPSHWERLLLNAYAWLAEPSAAGTELGGFVTPEGEPDKAEAALAAARRVGFERSEFRPPSGTHWRGLIGARTSRSVGAGTVAAWCAAAREAGYNWIVFTERYEEMDEAEWDDLVAACAAATRLAGKADDFLAVPGLDYPDQCGNRFVAFGPEMGWLDPEWLKPKRFGANEDMAVNYRFPDTILYELKNNRLDPHYLGQYYSIAIETYRGPEQKLTENALETYARMQYLRYNLHPSALHLVDSPDQVAAAAATGLQNYVRTETLAEVLPSICGHQVRYAHINHPVPMYVSEGPRVTAWQSRHTALGTRDRYLGGERTQHWEARLALDGTEPIADVRFQNGPHLLRRHRPGTATWDHVYHGFHDRQYNLFAVVTDRAGRRAITSCLQVLQLRNNLLNCSDNRNIILGGLYGHSRKPPRGFEMYFRSVRLGILGAEPPLFTGVRETMQKLSPIDDRHEYFTSKDIVILDEPIKATWPPGLVSHGNKVNGYPNADDLPVEDFDYTRRTYRLTTGHDQPELILVACDLTFKRPFQFPDKPARDVTIARLSGAPSVPADMQAIIVGNAREMTIRKRIDSPLSALGQVEPGEYLSIGPYLTGAGAILPIDQPLRYYASIGARGPTLMAGFDLPPSVAPGDRFTARYLYAVGNFGATVDDEQFATIIRELGLDQGQVTYTVNADTGKVVDTCVFLTVAAEDGAFSAHISRAPLPVDGLTLQIRGINHNWSAALYGRDNDRLSRIGGRDGTAWANVDISRDRDIFAGNLLRCDVPELLLIFLDGAGDQCTWQAHNPGTTPITATVRSHPRFTRITPFERTVTVPAGATVEYLQQAP